MTEIEQLMNRLDRMQQALNRIDRTLERTQADVKAVCIQAEGEPGITIQIDDPDIERVAERMVVKTIERLLGDSNVLDLVRDYLRPADDDDVAERLIEEMFTTDALDMIRNHLMEAKGKEG